MILKVVLQILFTSFILTKQYVLEIQRQNSYKDLNGLIQVLDQQLYLFQKQERINNQLSSTQHSNQTQQIQNNNKPKFNRKFIAHVNNYNQQSNNATKPNHGNYTSFPLYTTYGNAYLVDIYVGSQRQEFQVMLDTGSSYTWLSHASCSTCQQVGIKKFFDCDKSTTCGNQNETIQINYGKGEVNASVYRDQIGFAHNKFIANNQDFLLVTSMFDLDYFPGHGLFGLGFSAMSDGRKTILDNLKEQGQINKRQFAFSLSGEAENTNFGMTNKDFFILGGDSVDPSLADDSDFFTCPCSFRSYWSVQVQKIAPIISDVEIDLHFQSKQAIIDSGTSFIVFNGNDFKILVKFFKKLKKLNCEIDEQYNLLRCLATDESVYPIFKFTLCEQSRHILIYPNQYLLCDESVCYVRVSGMNLGLEMEQVIILGDIFMRTQYTVFNQDDSTISFYKKKKVQKTTQPPALQKDILDTSLEFKYTKKYSNFVKSENQQLQQNIQESSKEHKQIKYSKIEHKH
ncbi:hypothetical protein ABPG72_012777 [Tetrahymena utriculariae]